MDARRPELPTIVTSLDSPPSVTEASAAPPALANTANTAATPTKAHLAVPGSAVSHSDDSSADARPPSRPSPSHIRSHTRASPSIATIGSVLSEDGSPIHPIQVDFEPVSIPSSLPRRQQRTSSVAGTSDASDVAPVPSTSGLISEKHGHDGHFPAPVTAKAPKSKFSRLCTKALFWKRPSSDDGECGSQDQQDHPHTARNAASNAVILPDFTETEMAPFKASPLSMNALIDPKSLDALEAMGGTQSLLAGLHTSSKLGLTPPGCRDSDPHWDKRTAIYGVNRVPERPQTSLFALMWAALKDKVLVLLMIAAVISLALGLYTTFGTAAKTYVDENGRTVTEPKVDWVEGVAILVAVVIVTVVGSFNDYQKERQFRDLNAQKEDRSVKLIRAGTETLVNVHDLVVGDIALLEPGEIIPADGVLLDGFGVKCDESGATGESDAIRKGTFEQVRGQPKGDCFMISGSKVLEGTGRYVVTAVGKYSFYGKIMMSLRGDTECTPLQLKLNRLAELIAKLGASAGGLLFFILLIKFLVQLKTNPDRSAGDKAQSFTQVLIIAVTVVVVAVPEGLPLAVTLALAFATRRMTKMNLLVRVLGACETMANATVVCTDKTGTLTTNTMTVVAGSVGVHLKFASELEDNKERVNANDDIEGIDADDQEKNARDPSVLSEKVEPRQGRLDFSMDMASVGQSLSEPLRQLFNESICINSTAFEGSSANGEPTFVGSKTETALLSFAQQQGWENYKTIRDGAQVVQMIPFSSERKAMGVVIKLSNGHYRFLVKGASEVLTRLTDRYVYVANQEGDARPVDETQLLGDDVKTALFDHETRGNISRTILFYANLSLRTLALCYTDFTSWPPLGFTTSTTGEVDYKLLTRNLVLLAIVGIEDPLRPGVTDAVATCAGAGVAVKMVTGDNIVTAKSIATQCGIYTPGGIIMEGPVFRKLSQADMMEVCPRLQVLARSSPEDKKILVDYLKSRGDVVGVTGDGTNDGPALKTANVGFSMGITGTEVAKEASDIILMDDNFSSIVSAIMWGRCVNDSVKKFLQFQISVNITAVIVTFITAIASSSQSSVLTAVQLLWVNLIMDTFAALALATDPATPESLKRKPDSKMADLISIDMWKMIVGQSIFQLIAVLILNFAGKSILSMGNSAREVAELKTLVFNTFVFCQIFNQLNARVLDRKLNVFAGFWRNYYFMTIMAIMIGGQTVIIFLGGAAFQVKRIGGRDWAISVLVGLLSLPIGVLIKLTPSESIARCCYRWKLLQDPNELPIEQTLEEEPEEEPQYIEAIEKVRDNLAMFAQLRGGRVRSSSFVSRSRAKVRQARARVTGKPFAKPQPHEQIHAGALMTMVPSLVMSSVGAGWQPINKPKGSLTNPAGESPSKSTTQLWTAKYEVHPDTDSSDPVMQRFGDGTYRPPRSRSASTATSASTSSHSRQSAISPSPKIGQGSHNTLSIPPSPVR